MSTQIQFNLSYISDLLPNVKVIALKSALRAFGKNPDPALPEQDRQRLAATILHVAAGGYTPESILATFHLPEKDLGTVQSLVGAVAHQIHQTSTGAARERQEKALPEFTKAAQGKPDCYGLVPLYNGFFPSLENRTDIGSAQMLCKMYGASMRWLPARNSWLIYDGKCWTLDETGEAERRAKSAALHLANLKVVAEDGSKADEKQQKAAKTWAMMARSQKAINIALSLAKSEPGMSITIDELDSDPALLNVQNGTLNLDTLELSPHSSSDFISNICSAPYDADAKSELWEQTLDNLFAGDNELRAYVQRCMGYSIYGKVSEKAFWFCYGPSHGGKSTFLDIMRDTLGGYARTAKSSTWMVQAFDGGNRGDLVRLSSCRLVVTSEVKVTAKFDEEVMKSVTGYGDKITAAAKFEDEIEFTPKFALWMAGNNRPKITDGDQALWNRVQCVPFTNVIPDDKRDKKISEKLKDPAHTPAILKWLVDGYQMYLRDGIGSCSAVRGAIDAYQKENNAAFEFFSECITVTPGHDESVTAVRDAYSRWCKANNVKHALKTNSLTLRLKELGLEGNDDASKQQFSTGRDRAWKNITLTTQAPPLRYDPRIDIVNDDDLLGYGPPPKPHWPS